MEKPIDTKTAEAFATSWNNLPKGSVYTKDQFEDWFSPLTQKDIEGKSVLELGCGNGSLLVHMTNWLPSSLTGVDLGESVKSAKENLKDTKAVILKSDMTIFEAEEKKDLVYSIGVLHHLKKPKLGFDAVLKNTKKTGSFHCWVYAREGNAVIRYLVDPIRKVSSILPWWFTKFLIATPLSFLYFLYAKFIVALRIKFMPLYEYSKWICKRDFLFFRHVAFDQLVTPQTAYISKSTIEDWLKNNDQIDQNSTYIIFRNGNSWKFGGKLK